MSIVYLNGQLLPIEEAKISPQDRGFLFGDGIYEAIPFYSGKPFAMELHWKRLKKSLDFLRISFPESQESFVKICHEMLEKNHLDKVARSMVYLQVTRGTSLTRSHAFPTESLTPTVYAFCQETDFPTQERWDQGYTAALLPDRRWSRVDIKTVNLLPNILAAQDAKEQGADEAILHRDGVATEGTKTNFFAVLNDGKDTLVTHPTTHQILPGITRAIVLEIAKDARVIVEERPLTLEELRDNLKEAFFTSTTSEMKPAVAIDGRLVGDGKVGTLTRRLYYLFTKRIERETFNNLASSPT